MIWAAVGCKLWRNGSGEADTKVARDDSARGEKDTLLHDKTRRTTMPSRSLTNGCLINRSARVAAGL